AALVEQLGGDPRDRRSRLALLPLAEPFVHLCSQRTTKDRLGLTLTCTRSKFCHSRGMQRDDASVHDVVIAGAGPVGLFLACELRLAKLSVLVLEQAADPSSPLKRLPFGLRGLWGPSIEAFYRRGLLEPLAAQARATSGPASEPRPGST